MTFRAAGTPPSSPAAASARSCSTATPGSGARPTAARHGSRRQIHELRRDGGQALLPASDGWLALGRIGNGQRTIGSVSGGPSTAYAGTHDDPRSPTAGRVNLSPRPYGSLVAVGSTDELAAWTPGRSTDEGRTWTRAPQTADHMYEGKIRMTDVLTTLRGLVRVGKVVVRHARAGLDLERRGDLDPLRQ